MHDHSAETSGRYAYDGLDRTIHEKARLGILTCLITRPSGLSFNELKQFCDLTDGNLSRHLAMLEEAGLIRAERRIEGGRGHTDYAVTSAGMQRFQEYLRVLESVLRDARTAGEENATADPATIPIVGSA